jgi:GNAT superfamily N-acetyltransferase
MTTARSESIVLRASRSEDWRALRLLLPDAMYFGADVRTFVAVHRASGQLTGAIAISNEVRTHPHPGIRVALQVLPPWQNLRINELLLSAAEQVARSRGVVAIYAWGALECGSDGLKFWQNLGFDQAVFLQEGRSDIAAGRAFIEPYWQELIHRGKVPADINALPFNQVDPAALARLYADNIGGTIEQAFRKLTSESQLNYDPANTTAITQGSTVVGVSLGHIISGEVGVIEAVIIDKPFRGRWANLYLKRESWRRCAETGLRTLIHYTHNKHQDTRRFVDKIGTTVRDFAEPYRLLK